MQTSVFLLSWLTTQVMLTPIWPHRYACGPDIYLPLPLPLKKLHENARI